MGVGKAGASGRGRLVVTQFCFNQSTKFVAAVGDLAVIGIAATQLDIQDDVIFNIQHADQGDLFLFRFGFGLLQHGNGIAPINKAQLCIVGNAIKVIIPETTRTTIYHKLETLVPAEDDTQSIVRGNPASVDTGQLT